MIKYKNLFVERLDGKYQIWWMEQTGNMIRSYSGIYDHINMSIVLSSLVTSAWRTVKSTNEGKSNYRSPEAQAEFSILREYRIRKECGYVENIGDAPESPMKIEPMLAEKYVEGKVKFPVYSQPKLDGVRAISSHLGLYSRNWKPLVSTPHIIQAVKSVTDLGYKIDGELYNHELKNDFNKIISLARKTKPTEEDLIQSRENIQYWIYDIIEPEMKFSDRQKLLRELIKENQHLVLVETRYHETQDELDASYDEYLQAGYEGQMIRYDDLYENRRSKFLLKRKTFQDEEFIIEKIEEGGGNWAGYAKRVFCFDPKTKTKFTATLKNNQAWCQQILSEKDDYINGAVTVRYQNKTPDGIPRFPIAVAIYKGERDL